jgi:hypothetical protein
MFFPFTDYETFNYTETNEGQTHFYTIPYRCFCFIELVNSNATDPNKGVIVTADTLGYADDPTTPILFMSGRKNALDIGGLDAQVGSFPYMFTQAGARLLIRRADQYGQAEVRVHILKLPA